MMSAEWIPVQYDAVAGRGRGELTRIGLSDRNARTPGASEPRPRMVVQIWPRNACPPGPAQATTRRPRSRAS